MKAIEYFTLKDKEHIFAAIKKAENATSGEIRIYIEDRCKSEVLDRAAFIFSELNIHKTALRNGVLFYLALEDKKFAVIGDAGIHTNVGQDFWESVKELMQAHFKNEKYTDGLVAGILEAGNVLKKHFPFEKGDSNELSDEIIIA